MKRDLTIDSSIRDWVLIPLVGVVFMVGVFRYYLTQYMNNNKGDQRVTTRSAIQENINKNVIAKCQKLAAGGGLLSEQAFKTRKAFYCRRETGLLVELSKKNAEKAADPMAAMAMNPAMMTDMLKGNLSMVVSTMLQFAWASYFFSGFILAKVPFPLTQKFRGMLQRGVEIRQLDVRYISSISLYFMLLFGLSGLQNLIIGQSAEDEEELAKASEMDQMKMPMQSGGMPGQPPDYGKIFKSEKENIEVIKHEFVLNNSEDLAIARLKRELKL